MMYFHIRIVVADKLVENDYILEFGGFDVDITDLLSACFARGVTLGTTTRPIVLHYRQSSALGFE
jgi:hypothetical protein